MTTRGASASGNIQVLSHPDGFPCWVSDVRPGREHGTTCAKKADDLLPALELYEAEYQMPTLTDLGYIGFSPAIRHPHKKPKGAERATPRNTALRGIPHCWMSAMTSKTTTRTAGPCCVTR
jgi:hypothetical protein